MPAILKYNTLIQNNYGRNRNTAYNSKTLIALFVGGDVRKKRNRGFALWTIEAGESRGLCLSVSRQICAILCRHTGGEARIGSQSAPLRHR
jgi:hypothetical protein